MISIIRSTSAVDRFPISQNDDMVPTITDEVVAKSIKVAVTSFLGVKEYGYFFARFIAILY